MWTRMCLDQLRMSAGGGGSCGSIIMIAGMLTGAKMHPTHPGTLDTCADSLIEALADPLFAGSVEVRHGVGCSGAVVGL